MLTNEFCEGRGNVLVYPEPIALEWMLVVAEDTPVAVSEPC